MFGHTPQPRFRLGAIFRLVLLLLSMVSFGGCDDRRLPYDVSLVDVLLHPERRDRTKRVRVQGFLHVEGNDCCLYLNRDMAGSRVRTNAITLSPNRVSLRVYPETWDALRPLLPVQDKQVVVEGVWDGPTHLSDVTDIRQLRRFGEAEKAWQAVEIPNALARKIYTKRVSPVCVLSTPERYVGQEICLDGKYVGDPPDSITFSCPSLSQSFLYFATEDCFDNFSSGLRIDLKESHPRFFLPQMWREQQAGKRQIHGQWITVCGVLKSRGKDKDSTYYLGDVTEVVAPPVMANAKLIR